MKVLENTPAVLSLGKLCDENGYSYEWIHGQKPHLIKNGIRIQCNTENFVPIVVPGLSSSSSSSSHPSTSMTHSRQESNHLTSSSSSSTSPTTTVLSDSETREREDLRPLNGSSHICAKQKLLRKHKGARKSSWSQIGNLKSFTRTIPWNLAKPVKIFPGIIVRRHHTDRKQMGLLKEQCAE